MAARFSTSPSDRSGRDVVFGAVDLDYVSPARVREKVRALLADRAGTVVDDIVQVTDELVSNALRHGGSPRTCRLTRLDGERLRIEVDDSSAGEPRVRRVDSTGGLGLVLVSRLATDCAWSTCRR
jgi:anti-sigma regulatory factor (Ser/Thr protein kinase)